MVKLSPIHFIMEKNIEKNTFCSAMAGVKLLHYVDVKNVKSLTPYMDGWKLRLNEGHYTSRVNFNEVKVQTVPEGNAYTHTVEVAIPAKGGVAARDLMRMEQGRYIVLVTDNKNKVWLLGDTEEPMKVAVTDSNEGTADAFTGYRLTFTGTTQWPQMQLVLV